MSKAVRSFQDLNEDYQLKLYSGGDCIRYIQQHFDDDILDAFMTLKPYAYKCDLFRYLVLMNEGGYYSDMRQVCLVSFDRVFPPEAEWFSALDCAPYMHNAFIAAVPGHPWLRRAVDIILQSVREQQYGDCSLDPTGPGAFGKACDLEELACSWLVGEHRSEQGDGYIFSHLGERFILTKYRKDDGRAFLPGEWGDEDGGGQSYEGLWHARDVYSGSVPDGMAGA